MNKFKNSDLNNIYKVLISQEHKCVLYAALLTVIALCFASLAASNAAVDYLVKFFSFGTFTFIFISAIFVLFFNVAFRLKLSQSAVNIAAFFSKMMLKKFNYFVGFCVVISIFNFFSGDFVDAKIYMIYSVVTYFVANSGHFIILCLVDESSVKAEQ